MSDWTGLSAWARSEAGIELSPAQIDQLRAYLDALLLWNRKVALVSQRDPAEILAKHFADSILAAARLGSAAAIADLGSGGGFPGVVIAVMAPAARVCLMESRGKKASFLEAACRAAGLRSCAVYHGRIEDAAASHLHRGGYDVVISRALADLPVLEQLSRPLLAPHGRLIAMRAAGKEKPDGWEITPYTLPDGTPRQLVVRGPRLPG